MLSTTDDLRISELKELSTPQEVMGEIPRTLTATRVVRELVEPASSGGTWPMWILPVLYLDRRTICGGIWWPA